KNQVKPYKRFYQEDLHTIIRTVTLLNYSQNSIVYKALVFLLLDSGMRITELLNVKIKNIDFSSQPYKILLENTKTGKIRYAPFSDFSRDYLIELKNTQPINREYL